MNNEKTIQNRSNHYDSKRITRWLVSADKSAMNIDGKMVLVASDDSDEDKKSISNLKWCIREVHRLSAKGVNAYTKKVGRFCAVFSNLSTKEKVEVAKMELDEAEVEKIAEAENEFKEID